MNRFHLFAGMAIGPLALLYPDGAPTQDLPPGVGACAAEQDDGRRLACYDSEVARLSQRAPDTPAPTPPTSTPPTPTPTATQSPEESFGMTTELARRKQNGAGTPELERLTATVTKISSRRSGEVVMTLDNGQVWAQNSPDSFFRVRVGDVVTIKRAAMGSYMLAPPTGRGTRVTREQ